MSEILARLPASAPRRVIGIATLLALGGFMVWIALAHPPERLGWRLFLIGAGILALWLADAMRRATARHLELTRGELRDSAGLVLAMVADIRSIDRGVFAVKPSSGFLLRLEKSAPVGWAPGLWWRLGRSVGVGGVTAGAEGKYMAEVIAAMVAERKG